MYYKAREREESLRTHCIDSYFYRFIVFHHICGECGRKWTAKLVFPRVFRINHHNHMKLGHLRTIKVMRSWWKFPGDLMVAAVQFWTTRYPSYCDILIFYNQIFNFILMWYFDHLHPHFILSPNSFRFWFL